MKSTTLSAVAAIATLLWLGVAPTVHAVDLLRGDLVVTRPQGQDRDGQLFTSAVLRVDPVTGDRTVIAVLDQHDNIPFGVAIDTNRELFIARQSRGGPRGPSSSGESDVVHVDPVTGAQTVIVSFPTSSSPSGTFPIALHGIAIDAKRFYGHIFQSLQVLDVRSRAISRILLAQGPRSLRWLQLIRQH